MSVDTGRFKGLFIKISIYSLLIGGSLFYWFGIPAIREYRYNQDIQQITYGATESEPNKIKRAYNTKIDEINRLTDSVINCNTNILVYKNDSTIKRGAVYPNLNYQLLNQQIGLGNTVAVHLKRCIDEFDDLLTNIDSRGFNVWLSGVLPDVRLMNINDTVNSCNMELTIAGREIKTYYNDSTILSVGYLDKNNKKHGQYITYHKNGRIDLISHYINGKRSGEWFGFSNSGELTEIMNFDRPNVPFWNIYLISRVKYLDIYGNEYLFRSSKGAILAKGKYLNGNKTGKWIYYYQNGNIKSLGHYKKSQKTGRWREYHDNGEIENDGWYRKNVRHKVWLNYNENGELIHKSKYSKGNLIGKQEYSDSFKHLDRNGKLKDIYYIDNNKNKTTSYSRVNNMVIVSENMIGHKCVIAFNDDINYLFRINGIGLYNVALKDIEITDNLQYIEIDIKIIDTIIRDEALL